MVHGIFGSFSGGQYGGHSWQSSEGLTDFSGKLGECRIYDKKSSSFEGFVGVTTLRRFSGCIFFFLNFIDRSNDRREDSNTGYLLGIPERDTDLIECIRKNPQVLSYLFRRKFPDYDRSRDGVKVVEFVGNINIREIF